MIEYTEKTVNTQEISKVTCNMCGKEIEKDEHGEFADYIEIKKTWGYFSDHDGETHVFHICADCYAKMNFAIKPEITSINQFYGYND